MPRCNVARSQCADSIRRSSISASPLRPIPRSFSSRLSSDRDDPLDRRCLPRPARRQRLELLAGLDEDCGLACGGLIAAHDHVDIERIEFDAATDAAGPVAGDEGRTGAEEWVDYDGRRGW
jgi:hypothetical protein